jgi:hypothetical protein
MMEIANTDASRFLARFLSFDLSSMKECLCQIGFFSKVSKMGSRHKLYAYADVRRHLWQNNNESGVL